MIDSFENAPELIRVEDLHKSFGGLNVLNGITETIHKGEVVSLIGPSGSGKSTFLRCLNRLEEPTSGHIWFDGVDIADKSVNIDRRWAWSSSISTSSRICPSSTTSPSRPSCSAK